jgi:glycosyltransferase involved in cell wall biosynthesis
LVRIPFGREDLPRFVASFRRLLKEKRYHAIHDHQDVFAGLHFLAGVGFLPAVRIAHVHNPLPHIHSYSDGSIKKATVGFGRLCLSRLATHVLGTSDQVLGEYGFDSPRFSRQTVKRLTCGFDTSLFRLDRTTSRTQVLAEFQLPHDARILLFIGRLDSGGWNQKNPLFALETAREVIRRAPATVFLMAGEWGSVGKQLAEQVAGWDVGAQIKLLGPRRDVPRLMAAADLLVVPSVQEGLGMVIVEAQAAGLPVIASDSIPRESQVVADMVEYLPLATGAEFWARKVLERMARECPAALGGNAKVSLSPFSIRTSAAQLVAIYSGSGGNG